MPLSSTRKLAVIPYEVYTRLVEDVKNNKEDTGEVEKGDKSIDTQILEPVPPFLKADNDQGDSTDFLQLMPKNGRKKAELIMNYIKNHRDILDWGRNGELIYRGAAIPGSHISVILRRVTSNFKHKSSTPRGVQELLDGLSTINFPLDLLPAEGIYLQTNSSRVEPPHTLKSKARIRKRKDIIKVKASKGQTSKNKGIIKGKTRWKHL